MRISEKAVVLQTIRHGEKKFIVRLYTEQHGLLTAIAAAGSTAKSKVRHASILPLSLINAELIIKQNRELHQLTESSCYFISTGFGNAFDKLSIAQFLNEVLIKTLKEQGPNAALFHFIETCIRFLNDTERDYMNLHLYFMLELSKYLGFEPQNNFSSSNKYFDCREGSFSSYPLSFPLGLDARESVLFSQSLSASLLQTKLNNQDRRSLLESLIAYFKMHIPGFNELKSLEVLQLIMND